MSALRDRAQAATHHAGRTLARMATYEPDRHELRYGRWPYLTERLQQTVVAFNSGQATVCPHLRMPAVMHCTAKQPTALRCIPCAAASRTDPVEDRTCDRCPTYDPEGVHPGLVQHGPILMGYGLCDGCLAYVYGQGAA